MVHFDNISSPQAQTPQLRYASLHRSIEKGLASDDIWNELARICLVLGFNDEAVKAYHKVEGTHARRYLEVLLARHGLISPPQSSSSYSGSSTNRGHPQASRPPSGSHPIGRPSSGLHRATESAPRSGLREQLADSSIFLFVDHMPLTVIVATLTFPLVVGLGGFLTAGSPFFLLPAIALLPGLSVLGVVGAMGRRIMLEASQGMEDAPPVPELRELAREATRFLSDMLILLLVFLGPGAAMLLLSSQQGSAVGSIALGMLLLPMAMLLRQLSDDWRVMSPYTLLRAVSRGGTQYLAISLFISLMMLPAFVSAMITMGSHVYLQISVIGPLLVVPLFVTCRLLGGFFHIHHEKLACLVGDRPSPAPEVRSEAPSSFRLKRQAPKPSSGIRRTARSQPARQPLGAPSHPESRAPRPKTSKPRASKHRVPKPKASRQSISRSKPGRRKRGVARGHPKGSPVVAGVPSVPGSEFYNCLPSSIPEAGHPIATRREPSLDDQPDLSNLPGARVIKHEDRERSGAASSKRRQW